MSDIKEKKADEVFCFSCGEAIKEEAEICPKCGVRQKPTVSTSSSAGDNTGTASITSTPAIAYFIGVFKKYAVFSGRARRAEFWWFILIYAIASGILSAIFTAIGIPALSTIVSLGTMIPSFAVWWRRMHDVGKPGGYCFIPIYDIILAATEGMPGENQYGPDPKELS